MLFTVRPTGAVVSQVADDARAHGVRKAREHDVELGGLVVGVLPPESAPAGRATAFHRHSRKGTLEIDLDLAADVRAVGLAPHVEHAGVSVVRDGEVVLGASPVLRLPAIRDPVRARRLLRPVLHHDLRGRRRETDSRRGRSTPREPSPGRRAGRGAIRSLPPGRGGAARELPASSGGHRGLLGRGRLSGPVRAGGDPGAV